MSNPSDDFPPSEPGEVQRRIRQDAGRNPSDESTDGRASLSGERDTAFDDLAPSSIIDGLDLDAAQAVVGDPADLAFVIWEDGGASLVASFGSPGAARVALTDMDRWILKAAVLHLETGDVPDEGTDRYGNEVSR